MKLGSLFLGIAFGLPFLLCGAAGAEDAPPEGESRKPVPPALLQDLAGEMREDDGPPDPIEYLRSYRDWIQTHETPPPHTAMVHAQHDMWSGALKPKARRMTRRVETLMKRRYWVPKDGAAERVKPESWSLFTREIAALGSELFGAWKQYGRANPRPVSLGFGMIGYPRAPRMGAYRGAPSRAVPMSAWRGGLTRRRAMGVGRLEMRSYWNLMGGYNRAWEYSMLRRAEWSRRRRELIRKQKEFMAGEKAAANAVRDTLEQQMLSLQVLVAAMQAAEEHALRAEIGELPEGDILRDLAEQIVDKLREARLKAERYQGTSSSQWGTLLRSWVRVYKAGDALLRKEIKKIEKEEAAAEKAAAEDQASEGDPR